MEMHRGCKRLILVFKTSNNTTDYTTVIAYRDNKRGTHITNSKHWLLLHLEGLFSEKQPLPVGKMYFFGRHPFGPTPGGSKFLLRFDGINFRHLLSIVNFPKFIDTSGLRKVDLNFSLKSVRKAQGKNYR